MRAVVVELNGATGLGGAFDGRKALKLS